MQHPTPDALTLLSADIERHTEDWFAVLKQRKANGEYLVMAQATAAQEIFTAMDVPFFVLQWWSLLLGQRGLLPKYMPRLVARGYPNEAHLHAAPLATVLDIADRGPMGGLPTPDLIFTDNYFLARKALEPWVVETGAEVRAIEHTVSNAVDVNWWERIIDDWETVIGSQRLDLMEAELSELVHFLEKKTGRRFSPAAFTQVMANVNEQESWNMKTRDLVARTRPAPISGIESYDFVMAHQWWRGTPWAIAVAKRFYEEVERRAKAGEAACAGERIRILWPRPPRWLSNEFWEFFKQEYGAVMVWTNFLGIAPEGYIRHGGRPLRQLAARFVVMHDELGMPPWNVEWWAFEAARNQCQCAVTLSLEAFGSRGRYGGGAFAVKAFERAGIPLLDGAVEASGDPKAVEAEIKQRLADFLDREVVPRLPG